MSEEIQFFPGAKKAAMKQAGASSGDLWKVPVGSIRRHPDFNVRSKDNEYWAAVAEIKDSIVANGYYIDKPLAGYIGRDEGGQDVIWLTDGFTRMDAVEAAIAEGVQIETLPMVTKDSGTSMEDLTVAFHTGNKSRPLRPHELAVLCKRLIGYGVAESNIARRLVLSEKYVRDLLYYMAAPSNVRQLVEEGKVGLNLAISTLRQHGPKAYEILVKGIEQAQASGKDRATPRHIKAGAGSAPKVARPILLRSVEYLKEQKLDDDDRFLGFLAFLSGMKSAEEFKDFMVAEKEKAQSKVDKAEKKALREQKKAAKADKAAKSAPGKGRKTAKQDQAALI